MTKTATRNRRRRLWQRPITPWSGTTAIIARVHIRGARGEREVVKRAIYVNRATKTLRYVLLDRIKQNGDLRIVTIHNVRIFPLFLRIRPVVHSVKLRRMNRLRGGFRNLIAAQR